MPETSIIGALTHLTIAFAIAYFCSLMIREYSIYAATWLASKSNRRWIHRAIHCGYKTLVIINRHIWPLLIVWSYYKDALFDVFQISGIILAAIYAIWIHWISIAEQQAALFEQEHYRV